MILHLIYRVKTTDKAISNSYEAISFILMLVSEYPDLYINPH